jgi:hypothetical protein
VRGRAADLALAAAAAVLVTAFWKLRIFDSALQVDFLSVDAFNQIWPMWVRAGEELRNGHVPLWNPYQMAGGHPFLASVIYGVFYPLNFARLVLPADVAMEVTVVLHLFLAWVFTYAFCRSAVGLRHNGSAAAAIAFSLGGFVVFEATWFLPALSAAVWLPVALLAVDRIVVSRRMRWCAVLAVAVAMPILAGWLQTWFHSMQAVALYAAVRLLACTTTPGDPREPLVTRLRYAATAAAMLAFAVGLGTALAAVQLLPSMELQALGWRRAGGMTLAQQLFFPPHAPDYWWQQATDVSAGHPRPAYLGIATLALLVSGLALPLRSQHVALWTLFVWSVGVTLTTWTPLYEIYRALPGGTWFRFPPRILILASFAGAVLAGCAVDGLSRPSGTTRRVAATVLVAVFTIGLLAAAWSSARTIAYVTAAAAGIAILLWVPSMRRGIGWALAGLIAFDLFHATLYRSAKPFGHVDEAHREQRLLEYIADHQGFGRSFLHEHLPIAPAMTHKQGTLRRIFMITDYEVLTTERFQRYCNAMAAGPGRRPDRSFLGSCEVSSSAEGSRMLERLGARFAIVPRTRAADRQWYERSGWRQVPEALSSAYLLLEHPSPLPRAFLSYTAAMATTAEEAFGFVADASKPASAVVIETDGEAPRPAALPSAAIEAAEIAHYEANRVEIVANASKDGWLVLLDSYSPGWNAYVDGRPAPIYRANYLYRAVAVRHGTHRIEFRYEPTSFYAGALLSACSLLVLGFVAFTSRPVGTGLQRPARTEAS